MLLFALALASGCRPGPATDTASPDGAPWEQLAEGELQGLQDVVQRTLDGLDGPRAIDLSQDLPVAWVLDSVGRVAVMDERYHQSAVPRCLDPNRWDGLEARENQRGGCALGEVELRRGLLALDRPIVATAQAGTGLYLLDSGGALHRAELDPLVGNPLDYLRPAALAELGSLDAPLMAGESDQLYVADGSRILTLDLDGGVVDELRLPGDALLLEADGGPWVGLDFGVWRDAGAILLDEPPAGLTAAGGHAWVSQLGSKRVIELTGDGSEVLVEALGYVEGPAGPLAVDGATGTLFVATDAGVASVVDGELSWILGAGPVVDLAVAPSHELALLQDGGSVRVLIDEPSLVGPAALPVFIAGFVEKPRSPTEDAPCNGDEGLAGFVDRALANRELLADLPAPLALGITPHFSRRAAECGETARVRPAWDDPRTEAGVLYHQESDCAGDPSCYVDFLRDEAAAVEALGATTTWSSGLSPHTDLGDDWVAGLIAADRPDRYAFFSMSLLPEIPHADDPRAKDSLRYRRDQLADAWRASSAWAVDDTSGPLTIYPGDSRPAFNQGGCANLFVWECSILGLGGGQVLDGDDVDVLKLLLYRALAARGDSAAAWSFHLPDIGAWDYTQGCSVEDRVWTGDGCAAAELQAWLFDVHARLVSNGLVRWSLPSELERP